MAATRLIALHINKGKTVAQCLRERTDYAQNPEKTAKGELVTGYQCDPMTVDEEFLLSKRQYQHITGKHQKHEVIAYQIRQSFKPGEITPEEANQVGYELAERFTKGKHAFIVATHTDCAHIHNHIIFNSTTLDCAHKFKDFYYSGLAIQRLSDLICLEHGLSIIEKVPYSQRRKRTIYEKRTTYRDQIRQDIDTILKNLLLTLIPFCASWKKWAMKSRGASIYQSKGKTNSDSSVSILWVKGMPKKIFGLSLRARKSIVPKSNLPWQKRSVYSIFCLSSMIKFGLKAPAISSGLRTTI